MNAREVAANCLIEIFEKSSYNNIALKNLFSKNPNISSQDKAFITELVNGTLRNLIFIDYVIDSFSKTKSTKMKPFILNILRVSVYQINFMAKIPQSAICNEAVSAVKKRFKGLAPFVNGVLRNIMRNISNVKLPPEETEPIKFLSIKYSYPQWIIENWLFEMDYEKVKKICISNSLSPKISICINTNKTTKEELKGILNKEGIFTEEGCISSNSLYISRTKDITQSEAFKKGLFHIIDESSIFAVEVASPKVGQVFYDVCAAPGGKSFYASYLMENKGLIVSRDIYDHKINILNETKKRLGASIVQVEKHDALNFNQNDLNKADVLLLDAPCSSLGILRKKPDIKYNKDISHIDELVSIQRDMLANCSKYVKKGGVLVYSTCTISKKENLENVQWFCDNFDYELESININEKFQEPSLEKGYIQILPFMFQTDGFFVAKFKKI